jgi:hypothetical protein
LAVQGSDTNGFPKVRPIAYETPPVRCFPGPFYVPCFSFASSNLISEVPSDPKCDFVFWPEMYVQSARYWTHGWTFLQPKEAVCFHLNDQSYRPLFWEQLDDNKANMIRRAKGTSRAMAVLRRDQCAVCASYRNEHTPAHGLGHIFEASYPEAAEVHRDGYGLGQVKTLASFEEHCGVNIPNNIATKARIGCCQHTSTEERLAKFGRLDVYDMLIHQYEKSET